MKKIIKKLSVLFASLAMVMGVATLKEDAHVAKAASGELVITIDNFTEISNSYTTKYTHTYTLSDGTSVSVDAYGVFKNSNGIQMNSGKDTYIKNTDALPGAITQIQMTWSATGKNSPTLHVSNGSVASQTSTSLGKQSNSLTTQTITVDKTKGYNYFYFDGTTVSGACYMSELKITYADVAPASAKDIIDLINAIGTVAYTPECKDKIAAARAAYDANPGLHTQVTNYSVLTAAEAEYERLEASAPVVTKMTFGSADGSINFNSSSKTYTDNFETDWTFTATGSASFTANAEYSQLGSGSKPMSKISLVGTFSKALNINKISVKFGGFSSTAGNITITVGGNEYATGSLSGTTNVIVSAESSVIINAGETISIQVDGISKGVKLYSIEYTGTRISADSYVLSITKDREVLTVGDEGTLSFTLKNVSGENYTGQTTSKWSSTGLEDDFDIDANTGYYMVGTTSGEITINLVVTDADNKEYKASVTFIVLDHKGTAEDPYSVTDIVKIIDDGSHGTNKYYIKGIVSEIVGIESDITNYGNHKFFISDDGTTSAQQFEAYQVYYLNNEQFTAADQVEVKDTVVLYGAVTKYNTTYETVGKGEAYVYSHTSVAREAFINEWKALRDENGNICGALNDKVALDTLIKKYDALTETNKAIVGDTTDVEGVKIKESVEYLRSVLKGEIGTTGEYGSTPAGNALNVLTEIENSSTLITLVAILGVIAISAYYFIEKRKLAK